MVKNDSMSGVSQAIKKTMHSYKNEVSLIEKMKPKALTIKIANTTEERESVFRLAYQVYLEKGYIKENHHQWLVNPYDSNQETVILIVQDIQKNVVGTLSLVFDNSCRLPADKLYKSELGMLRNTSKKIAEISRLVISPDFRNSKEILVLLFNYLAIYTHHVKKYDQLVVQVSPRHCDYYKTLLCFEKLGDEKPCPQVCNVPAVLLSLPIIKYQLEAKRCQNSQSMDKKERSLYQYFLKLEQENLVANYLAKQAKPMTTDEKIYFGFTESGISKAVCV